MVDASAADRSLNRSAYSGPRCLGFGTVSVGISDKAGNYLHEAWDRKRSLLIKSVSIDIPATAAAFLRRSEDRRAGSGMAEHLSGAPRTCEIRRRRIAHREEL